MRTAQINRKTAETDIRLTLSLDGFTPSKIDTGCGFLDHMLTLFAMHSGWGIEVACKGDVNVDYHHTVEDIAICLGDAFLEAIGSKAGIARYGDIIIPMDEALIMAAVDISGREYLGYELSVPAQKVGDFDTELCEEFFRSFVRRARVTLHIRQLSGTNSHHIIEGAFKAVARALAKAATVDPAAAGAIPSTKGVL